MLKVLLYGLATFMETGIGVWIFGQMFPKRSMETEKDKTVWKIILIILLYFTAYSFCGSYLENNIETKKTILIILLVLVGICLIPDCVVRLKRIRNFQSVLFFCYDCCSYNLSILDSVCIWKCNSIRKFISSDIFDNFFSVHIYSILYLGIFIFDKYRVIKIIIYYHSLFE